MRITDLKPHLLTYGHRTMFMLKVQTDAGLYGWGEGGILQRGDALQQEGGNDSVHHCHRVRRGHRHGLGVRFDLSGLAAGGLGEVADDRDVDVLSRR